MANCGSAEELTDALSFYKGDIGYFDPIPMTADYKPIETYFKLKNHSIFLRLATMTSGVCR